MTCVLTVVSLMKSSWPISAFERPSAIRRKTSCSRVRQLVELLRRRVARDARELLDHALRDRGREQRVAGGDGADRRDQLLGRVVLEHEAARAGAERLVDVLVEVERREDQDPRGRRRRRGCAGSPRARRARACGCPSARRSDGSARPCRPPRARCSPRPRPRCPPRRRAACGSRRGPSTGRRRRARGCSSAVAVEREARAEDEAAAGRGARGHLAAVDLDALADADEPVAEAVARRGAARRRRGPRSASSSAP